MKTKLLTILLLLTSGISYSASDILNTRITIKLQNKPVATILDIISETNSFYFSYNPNLFETHKLTNLHADNKTVKQVLDELFEEKAQYQQISNHIIIKPKPIVKPPKKTSKKATKYYYNTTGYIRDQETGLGLSAISVYEKSGLNNTLSEDFGYYQLKYTSKKAEDSIFFASPLIKDTVIVVQGSDQPTRNDISFQLEYEGKKLQPLKGVIVKKDSLYLEPLTIQIDTIDKFRKLLAIQKSKVKNLGIGNKISNQAQKITNLNITDSFVRNSQVSLFTPIGTNGSLSPTVTNNLSLNLVAGYNGGVNGLEIGGAVNIIANNVNGLQIAGFGNYVENNVSGIQIAGFSNHNSGSAKALTIAGFYNYQAKSLMGTSIAGFANWHQDSVLGSQIAGFTNKAQEVTGAQIAGFLNKTKYIKGSQIGFINIADSIDGVQIGFFNIAKKGLHQLELGYSYTNDLNLSFRTGTEKLYTIIGARIESSSISSNSWLGFSYGVGSNFKLHPKAFLNLQATAYQPTKKLRYDYLRLHNQLNLNLEIRPFKRIAFFGGSGLAVNVFDYADPNLGDLQSKYGNQNELDNGRSMNVSLQPTWQFGVRFF